MKGMRAVMWLFIAAATIGFVFSFSVEAGYRARAQTVQLVKIDPREHSRFGPVTDDVGDPIQVLVDDPAAYMKNKTAMGLPKLDVDYLEKKGIPLVKLDSLLSLIKIARLGCVAAILIAIAGLILLRKTQTPLPNDRL